MIAREGDSGAMTMDVTIVTPMPTVSKSELKARMLAYFREVEATGEPLIVTDAGRPVLRVVPIEPPPRTIEDVFADVRGKGVLWAADDLDAPTTEEWPQLRDDVEADNA
jgi:prevent-host-death family protein